MRQVGSVLWPKLRVLQLYGANTDVGKTIFSTVLCNAFARKVKNVYYLKPVSTGPANDADDRCVERVDNSEYCDADCLPDISRSTRRGLRQNVYISFRSQ